MEQVENQIEDFVWIEISKKKLSSNFSQLRSLIGKHKKIALCIKGNAYGHGMVLIAKCAQEFHIDYICVTKLDDAIELRKAQITIPILLMSYIVPKMIPLLDQFRITPLIENIHVAEEIQSYALQNDKIMKVHLEFDTGIHREGFPFEDARTIIYKMKQYANLTIEAIATHFVDSDDLTATSMLPLQLSRFNEIQEIVHEAYSESIEFYCSNSSATLLHPETHFHMIWPGLSFYGYYPSKQVEEKCRENDINLKQALSLKSKIVAVHLVKAGETVGYSQSFIASKDLRVATIPCGYFDGIDRKNSNKGKVIIKNVSAPIIGIVNMNSITVDISHIPKTTIGDIVTIIGGTEEKSITIESIADAIQTINYEVMTRLGDHIPRYIKT